MNSGFTRIDIPKYIVVKEKKLISALQTILVETCTGKQSKPQISKSQTPRIKILESPTPCD